VKAVFMMVLMVSVCPAAADPAAAPSARQNDPPTMKPIRVFFMSSLLCSRGMG
jgi:hypothetical protein